MSLAVDLLRPVLSMPPVILMDGGSSANSSPRLNVRSIPASPIVEMPPSPAPSQQPLVEFPCEDDVYEYDEDGYVVEVRKLFISPIVTNTIPPSRVSPAQHNQMHDRESFLRNTR